VFHGTRERFGGSELDTRCLFCLVLPLTVEVCDCQSVGVVFPRRLLPTKPLTPLSPLPLPRNVGVPSHCLPSTRALPSRRAVISREEAAKVALTTGS